MATRKKINLATAKVADGKAQSVRSVYELCGIATTNYAHRSLAEYSKTLNGLDLIELQDHAFKIGVLAGPDRGTLINRLEEKYIVENRKFAAVLDEKPDTMDPVSRAAAEKILSRGR